mmetsp:Transcript_52801/g.140375  ORF Transcript_52801/g.140375 Transcript_52801/m.140375 type:complete len:926 (+) Transcript_52801:137-2914(+)
MRGWMLALGAVLATAFHVPQTWGDLVVGSVESSLGFLDAKPGRGGAGVLAARPSEDQHFREVSTTVWCVIVLTCVAMGLLTLLAISKNIDEQAGRREPSALTATLMAAAPALHSAPMLCMVFLAGRMRVLQLTDNLGEPPVWVKAAMIGATACAVVHAVLVILSPTIIGSHAKSDPQCGAPDIHHVISAPEEHYPQRYSVAVMRAMLAVAMNVCFAVVCFGICTFQYDRVRAGKAPPVSPAVGCTLLLGVIYNATYLTVLCCQTNRLFMHQSELGNLELATRAALPVVDLAPMMAILFLAARMRALWMGRENPQGWAQSFFITATLCLALCAVTRGLEALTKHTLVLRAERWKEIRKEIRRNIREDGTLARTIIVDGVEIPEGSKLEEDLSFHGRKGRDGVNQLGEGDVVQLNPPMGRRKFGHLLLGVVSHILMLLMYVSLAVVIYSIFEMKPADGKPRPPVSPAVSCIMQLAMQFFLVYLLAWMLVLLTDLFPALKSEKLTALADSLRATVIYAPLLAALFFAARMRALQISDGKGQPQEYAQEAMQAATLAVAVQAGAVVLIPLVTEKAPKTDAEGNIVAESRPMALVWLLSTVRYVAIFCLFGGAAVVIYSILTITPEEANASHKHTKTFQDALRYFIIAMVVVSLALLLSISKVVGMAVKFAIEAVDRELLGVQMEIGFCKVDMFSGTCVLQDVYVRNPTLEIHHRTGTPVNKSGVEYDTPFLMYLHHMDIGLGLWKLVSSTLFEKKTTAEIHYIDLQGVEMAFDKPMLTKQSNVEDITHFMDEYMESLLGMNSRQLALRAAEMGSSVNVVVHKVLIRGVVAKAQVGRRVLLQVPLGDLELEDVDRDIMKGGNRSGSAGAVVKFVTKTLCGMVTSNMGTLFRGTVGKMAGKTALAGRTMCMDPATRRHLLDEDTDLFEEHD